VKTFSFYLWLTIQYGFLGQLQTSYDFMCNLISNVLHNLANY
jgi:hypothetical protein